MASRYDYVKYDEQAMNLQAEVKLAHQTLESMIDGLKSPRAKALAHTKLEECYMWIGKAIRDDQIERNGGAELQEQRGNE